MHFLILLIIFHFYFAYIYRIWQLKSKGFLTKYINELSSVKIIVNQLLFHYKFIESFKVVLQLSIIWHSLFYTYEYMKGSNWFCIVCVFSYNYVNISFSLTELMHIFIFTIVLYKKWSYRSHFFQFCWRENILLQTWLQIKENNCPFYPLQFHFCKFYNTDLFHDHKTRFIFTKCCISFTLKVLMLLQKRFHSKRRL